MTFSQSPQVRIRSLQGIFYFVLPCESAVKVRLKLPVVFDYMLNDQRHKEDATAGGPGRDISRTLSAGAWHGWDFESGNAGFTSPWEDNQLPTAVAALHRRQGLRNSVRQTLQKHAIVAGSA